MKLTTILFSILFVLGATACGGSGEEGNNSAAPQVSPIETVGPEAFQSLLAEAENPHLVDVRTPGEVAGGRLEGAVNIDWKNSNFEAEIKKLDTSRPMFVYCAVGGRSARAARKMSELGFPKVVDMSGGYTEWSSKGMKTVK